MPLDDQPVPPVAAQRPHDVDSPHGRRSDPYYWLRDDARVDPDVLAYINAENAYTEAVLAPARELEDTLFGEMRARVKEDDAGVPVLDRGYWYYVRYETGKQYPIYARKKGALTADEEIILDGNALARRSCVLQDRQLRGQPRRAADRVAEDTVGRNQFVLRVKNLETGAELPDTGANIHGALAWASDNRTLFYGGKDPVTLRADRVFRLPLGGAAALVHHETDGKYYVGVSTTKSHRYVVIGMRSTMSSETLLIDAHAPESVPRVFLPRSPDHLYDVAHLGERFIVRTNDRAKNFRVVEVRPGDEGDLAAWTDVIPHRTDTLIESVAAYDRFLAASVRTGGLRKVLVLRTSGRLGHARVAGVREPHATTVLGDRPRGPRGPRWMRAQRHGTGSHPEAVGPLSAAG